MAISNPNICIFITIMVFSNSAGHYGRSEKRYPPCSFKDPVPFRNANVDTLSGKLWYSVRVSRGPPAVPTDVTIRFFAGTNSAILTKRLGDDPGICKGNVLRFTKDKDGKGYAYISASLEKPANLRILYLSKKFMILRICTRENSNGECDRVGFRIYSISPDLNISKREERQLDRGLRRSTCSIRVKKDFINNVYRQACPDLMLPGTASSRCY